MTADEVLNLMEYTEEEELEYCLIDQISRTISIPEKYRLLGVEGDQRTNRIWFKCPAVVGDNVNLIDYALMIIYQNAVGDKYPYLINDAVVEGDYIIFSWELERSVTAYIGEVGFVFCATKSNTDGVIENEWNTTVAKSKSIVGMDVEYDIEETEETDLVAQIYAIVNDKVSNMETFVEEAIAEATADFNNRVALMETELPTKGDAIVQSAEGEAIAVSDASDDGFRGLNVFGKSEQFSTTGKNLIPNTATTKTTNGVTFTVNDDGSITVDGTATATADLYVAGSWASSNTILAASEDTYVVSGSGDAGLRVCAINNETVVMNIESGTSSVQTTFPEGITAFMIRVETGNTFSNLTYYPMIRLASVEDDTYEPYTGGIPSPNPSYPQEIVSPGDDGKIEVGVYGANLNISFEQGSFGITSGESIFATGWPDTTRLKTGVLTKNNYYIASSESVYQVYPVIGTDVVENNPDSTWHDLPYVQTNNTYGYARFLFRKSDNSDITPDAPIMISLVEVEYEEPKDVQQLPISTSNGLPGIKVTDASLANYTDADGQMWCADEVDLERGVYVKRVYHKIFDGTESIVKSPSIDHYYTYKDANIKFNSRSTKITGAMCNILSEKTPDSLWSNDADGFAINPSDSQLRIRIPSITDVTTVDEFKARLNEWYENGEPMELITLLATPIETALSDEEIAQYKALHTNYPNTTILNDEGAWMGAEYNADTKIYIDNKFTELTSAILSLGGNV